MSNDLATMIAKLFIQRRDVKAVQTSVGGYKPVTKTRDPDSEKQPWKMADIEEHLLGNKSYGHYLLDTDNKCKLFAFDIDLKANKPPEHRVPFTGVWPEFPALHSPDTDMSNAEFIDKIVYHEFDPREAWRDRSHPSRDWTKFQMRQLTTNIARVARDVLDVPVATAYSGNKGVHVYCFTGPVAAQSAREGAELVLEALGTFEPVGGKAFYEHVNQDPLDGFPNWSVEVFPKQDTLSNDGGFGNLMRLPLGRNAKSSDPTFFIDERAPLGQLVRHPDPLRLLETGNPWL